MCAKHLRESQDLTQWRDIFCQWIGKLNVVKVSHSQIYIQIKSNLNEIPLCFCMSETRQADSKFTLLFSHLVVSDCLWPQGLQHTRLPCPSPTPGACSNSCPLSQRCHPTISSSVIPFSSCPQSIPSIRVFLNGSALRQEMVKDRNAWHAAVHRVTKSQTWLSDWTATSFL